MFRRVLLAASGAIALSGAALAAEPLPSPPPPPMWTGFYAGLNAGYAFGSNDVNLQTVSVFFDNPFMFAVANLPAALAGTGVLSAHNSGFIGGGQLGFNHQFATSWVAGIEADIQGTGARASIHAIGIAPDPLSVLLGLGFPTNAVSNLFASDAVDYLGTVRGRIGFLATPTLLIYGDGGFAYGGVHQDIVISTNISGTPFGGTPASGGFSRTRPGWTAGGGLEWMFLPNWSLKAEYLYYDLGTTNFAAGAQTIFIGIPPHLSSEDASFARTRWNGNIVRAGLNYHFNWLPAPADPPSGAIAVSGAALAAEPLSPSPLLMWTGFYAGLNAGYTFGGSNDVNLLTVPVFSSVPFIATEVTDPAAASSTGVLSAHNSGFIGGGQLGYNYQFATSWAAGIEADIQGTGARASSRAIGTVPTPVFNLFGFIPVNLGTLVSNLFASNAVDYLGTVRGRLGFLATPALLIYGDGGFAYGGVHQDTEISTNVFETVFGGTPASGGFSRTRPGWSAGGGLEWMFMPNWSLKAEYLYYDLGTTSFAAGVQTVPAGIPPVNVSADASFARTRWNGNIVRAGINYHFNWLPAPVVAKY